MGELQAVLDRFWDELVNRPSGPLAFRFILQPIVASILAICDGIADARAGRVPYFWTILTDASQREEKVAEGLRRVSKVMLLAVAIDAAYTVVVFHGFRPVETLVIAFALGYLPYLLVRGPAGRLARLRRHAVTSDGSR